MPKIEHKQIIVEEIKEKLNKAKSVVIINTLGLTVLQDTELRKQLREAGIDYKVYKNTLFNLAIKGTEYEQIEAYLAGPSTFAFSYDDATLAARIINKNLKAMPVISFKSGIIDGVLYDEESIKVVAAIPSKEELISKLLGSFKNPVSGFARLVKAISEKKAETV